MATTSTMPTTEAEQALLDRVNAIVADEEWERFKKGFERSIIGRAAEDLTKVDLTALQTAVESVESDLFYHRHRRQENSRVYVLDRNWFRFYERSHPEEAVFLSAPLPQTCSIEQLKQQGEILEAARDWAREDWERREAVRKNDVARLQSRHTAAIAKVLQLSEYCLVDPDMHAVITAGLPDDAKRTQINEFREAINAFFDWLNGSDRATRRMGLATTPVGTNHGHKGARRSKRSPREQADA